MVLSVIAVVGDMFGGRMTIILGVVAHRTISRLCKYKFKRLTGTS